MKNNSKFLKSSLVIALVAIMLLSALAVIIPTKALAASDDAEVSLTYRAHTETYGWTKDNAANRVRTALDAKEDGKPDKTVHNYAGTTGEKKRVEALEISFVGPEGSKLHYRAYVQGSKWGAWQTADGTAIVEGAKPATGADFAGTTGQYLRLEGIQIAVENLEGYEVWYRAHVQNESWQPWVKADVWSETVENSQPKTSDPAHLPFAGTTGKFERIEAIQIAVVKNLDPVKEKATDELKAYVDLTAHPEATEALNAGLTAVDAAETVADINKAVADAKAAIDNAIALKGTKDAALAEVDNYRDVFDGYRLSDQTSRALLTEAENAINAATTADQVSNALKALEENINKKFPTLKGLVEASEKAKKEVAAELQAYRDAIAGMEGLNAGQKAALNDMINSAADSANDAYQAKDVESELKDLEKLLPDEVKLAKEQNQAYAKLDTYLPGATEGVKTAVSNAKANIKKSTLENVEADVKKAVSDVEKLIASQNAANSDLDVYENMAGNNAILKDAITGYRNKINNAKTAEEVETAIDEFNTYMNTNFKSIKDSAEDTILANAKAAAIEELEQYLTSTDVEDSTDNPVETSTSVKNLAKKAIEDINKSTMNNVTDVRAKVQETKDAITARLERLEKEAEDNKDSYNKALEALMEELDLYSDILPQIENLDSAVVSRIEDMIRDSKAIVIGLDPTVKSSTTTTEKTLTDFTKYMEQYYPEVAEKVHNFAYTKAYEAAMEKLNSYAKSTNTQIRGFANNAKSSLTSNTTKTAEAVNAILNKAEVEIARVEALAELDVYLQDNTPGVSAIVMEARKAITELNANTSTVKEVEDLLADAIAKIRATGSAFAEQQKELVNNARKDAKDLVDYYKEVGAVPVNAQLNAFLTEYKASLDDLQTVEAIEAAKNQLRTHIENWYTLLDSKLKMIDEFNKILSVEDKTADFDKYETLANNPEAIAIIEDAIADVKLAENKDKLQDIKDNLLGRVADEEHNKEAITGSLNDLLVATGAFDTFKQSIKTSVKADSSYKEDSACDSTYYSLQESIITSEIDKLVRIDDYNYVTDVNKIKDATVTKILAALKNARTGRVDAAKAELKDYIDDLKDKYSNKLIDADKTALDAIYTTALENKIANKGFKDATGYYDLSSVVKFNTDKADLIVAKYDALDSIFEKSVEETTVLQGLDTSKLQDVNFESTIDPEDSTKVTVKVEGTVNEMTDINQTAKLEDGSPAYPDGEKNGHFLYFSFANTKAGKIQFKLGESGETKDIDDGFLVLRLENMKKGDKLVVYLYEDAEGSNKIAEISYDFSEFADYQTKEA